MGGCSMQVNLDSREFWASSSSWPVDGAGYVFLARAVDAIGHKLFPLNWNMATDAYPREPADVLPIQQPSSANDREMVIRGYLLIGELPTEKSHTAKLGSFGALRGKNPTSNSTPPVNALSDEDWLLARKKSQALYDERVASIDRWKAVIGSTLDLLRQGALVAHTPLLAGTTSTTKLGLYRAIPIQHWRNEHAANRFDMCQFDLHNAFVQITMASTSTPAAKEYFRHLFVPQKSLDRYLRKEA